MIESRILFALAIALIVIGALMIICGVVMLIRQISSGPKEIGYRQLIGSPISAHLPHKFRADGDGYRPGLCQATMPSPAFARRCDRELR